MQWEAQSDSCISMHVQMRAEGKEYTVREGDVMLFRFNV